VNSTVETSHWLHGLPSMVRLRFIRI